MHNVAQILDRHVEDFKELDQEKISTSSVDLINYVD